MGGSPPPPRLPSATAGQQRYNMTACRMPPPSTPVSRLGDTILVHPTCHKTFQWGAGVAGSKTDPKLVTHDPPFSRLGPLLSTFCKLWRIAHRCLHLAALLRWPSPQQSLKGRAFATPLPPRPRYEAGPSLGGNSRHTLGTLCWGDGDSSRIRGSSPRRFGPSLPEGVHLSNKCVPPLQGPVHVDLGATEPNATTEGYCWWGCSCGSLRCP